MQKWLIEGDIIKLEESWEDEDTSSSEESEEEGESDEKSDTGRDQSSSCSQQEVDEGPGLAGLKDGHPKGEMRISHGQVSSRGPALGRRREQSSP